MAAKLKLTEEIIDMVCAIISAGGYRKQACAEVGITDQTLRNWEARGRNPKAPALFREFVRRMDMAEAAWENSSAKAIQESGQWRARAWLLERKVPERFSKVEDQLPDEEGDGQMDLSALTKEERLAFRRLLMKVQAQRSSSSEGDK